MHLLTLINVKPHSAQSGLRLPSVSAGCRQAKHKSGRGGKKRLFKCMREKLIRKKSNAGKKEKGMAKPKQGCEKPATHTYNRRMEGLMEG